MASTITTTGALFQAGGLASGLDTTSIVNSVITADSAPMLQVQAQQAAYQVQISTIASLTTKLQAFQKATDALGTSGLAPTKADSTYTDFTVSGSPPSEGDYSVQVETMARAAKMRSDPFSSADDPSALGLTGNLQFSIDGVTSPSTAINMTGKSLADIADAINKQVPQVTAAVISTGTSYCLSVTRTSTGFTSTTFDQALQVIGGQGLNLQTIQDAQNATLKVDNLEIKSQSNTITGAIPGATLTLRGQSNVATDVNFARDTSSAATSIQSFITAYNDVVTTLTSQLQPDPSQAATNNPLISTTLLGLEHSMQGLLSTKVNSTGTICTLSDLNVSMQDDGTLALDQISYQKTFADALASDPQASNQLFTKATTGIGALVDAMVNRQLQPETVQMDDGTSLTVDGALVGETSMLKAGINSMNDTVSYWQNYLDNERTRLTSTFTAMEGTIATLNMASNYLNAMFYSSSGSSVNATGYKTSSNG
jgi:flagellar hook-associated protein 2